MLPYVQDGVVSPQSDRRGWQDQNRIEFANAVSGFAGVFTEKQVWKIRKCLADGILLMEEDQLVSTYHL